MALNIAIQTARGSRRSSGSAPSSIRRAAAMSTGAAVTSAKPGEQHEDEGSLQHRSMRAPGSVSLSVFAVTASNSQSASVTKTAS
jgi:hypothetical protein